VLSGPPGSALLFLTYFKHRINACILDNVDYYEKMQGELGNTGVGVLVTYFKSFNLEGLRKTKTPLRQDNRYPYRYSNSTQAI